MELEGSVAIVTGGTAGIGKAIARRFVEEGAKVAILGRTQDEGKRVEAQLLAVGRQNGAGDCVFLRADVADSTQVRAAIADIKVRWNHVHIVVNNAAMMKTGPLVDMDEEDWDKTMAVNLRGPFLIAKYAIPLMPEGGAIINISSVHALATDEHSAAYSASKGGLETLTRALSLECYGRKIRVNALRLGAVDTDMLWDNPEVKSGGEKIDPDEVGTPREVAEAALFFASRRSSFVSGAILNVDGGRLPILGSHAD